MEDARKPILQIANKIGIWSCYPSKVAKTKSGVISGSKFVVNHKVLGYNTMAFVEFT
jgi:Lrp/AsnC family transcriptional regulator for asnA, asnC and gidA